MHALEREELEQESRVCRGGEFSPGLSRRGLHYCTTKSGDRKTHASRTAAGTTRSRTSQLVLFKFLLSLPSIRSSCHDTTVRYKFPKIRRRGGQRHLRPRQKRQNGALRLSCRKAKQLALCNGIATRCCTSSRPHLTLSASHLELLGVTGAPPSASC